MENRRRIDYGVMTEEEMGNMPASSGGRMYGLKDPVRSDVQKEAFIHLIMQNTGMDRDEAEAYVNQKGMEAILAQFQGGKKIADVEKGLEEAKSWWDARKANPSE